MNEFKNKVNKIIEYHNNNGKLPSTISPNNDIRKLGTFLVVQKRLYRNNKLSKTKIDYLNKIPNFCLSLSKGDLSFNNNINKIKLYYDEYKKIPFDDRSIKLFLANQRYLYKHNNLREDRYNTLISIPGIDNYLKENIDPNINYEKKVNDIIKYYDKNGKLPSNHNEDNEIRSLGGFLYKQKRMFKQNKLSDERYNILKKSDVIINYLNQKYVINKNKNIGSFSFEEKIKAIIDFHKKYNKLPSSISKNDDEKSLSNFIRGQKKKYNQRKMFIEHYNMLMKIPGFIDYLLK